MPEWSNGAVSKTVVGFMLYRGFESLSLRQFNICKLNLRSDFLKSIKPCNPSNSGTWRVSFSISVVLSSLQKFIKIAKTGAKILCVSAWVVLFQKRWTSVNTDFVGFVTNFFKWMCERIFDDFCELLLKSQNILSGQDFLPTRDRVIGGGRGERATQSRISPTKEFYYIVNHI